MATKKDYRIYCNDCAQAQQGTSILDVPPSECPINAGHSVVAASKVTLFEYKENNLTATTNPTVNDDINDGYSVESRWLNITLNFEFVCVDNTSGAAEWLPLTKEIADIHMSFGGELAGCCRCGLMSWDVQRRFIFRGINVLGTPVAFKAVVFMSDNAGDVRLYDVTNSSVIAVIYNYTNTSWEIVSDMSLDNLPTGEAVFEVQCKVNNSGDWNYLSAASLLF